MDAETARDTSILVSSDGPVTTVTLNRPDRRNALSLDLMRRLIEVFDRLDDSTELVILAGSGPVFSAGHDIAEMNGRDPGFYDELFATCTSLMTKLHRIPQPVIARVQGMATAAGCQLVASCDLAVATTTARFATPGVRIGLFCSTPMVPISRAVGRKRAMEMLLTGDPIDAPTAREWGLVNRIVDESELDAEVERLAGQILRWSPQVIALGKGAFYRQLDLPEDSAYEVACPVMADNASRPDAQEGFAAFLEKRQPRWPGKEQR